MKCRDFNDGLARSVKGAAGQVIAGLAMAAIFQEQQEVAGLFVEFSEIK